MKQNKLMPVGIEDFKTLRERYYFVDKTKFMQELIDGHSAVTLITRPRRFGKTLTMSMLYYFFTNENAEENRRLFDGTEIAEAGEKYMAEQGTRPVVFLTLKDVKGDTFDSLMIAMQAALQNLFLKFRHILKSDDLDAAEKEYFESIKDMKASPDFMQFAVSNLTKYLHRYYGRTVLLLIDEYDAPIQSAWEYGYYDKAIGFFRNFLSSALKTNSALDFAVLTGVMRIAKESIFSALNNLEVASVLQGDYADIMGFTQDEIKKLAEDIGCRDKLNELRDWYDGYNFSGKEIYNPWSVISYFRYDCRPAPYWVNTSGNVILTEMLAQTYDEQAEELSSLLNMGTLDTLVRDAVIYDDIHKDRAALYTMLLATGYLTKVPGVLDQTTGYCTVAIPNREVQTVYASEVLNKLNPANPMMGVRFLKNLLTGQADAFAKELSACLENIASYYDTMNRESFYHSFLMGMLALITPGQYAVKSNRESGFGRFDLAIFPKNPTQTGVVMEIKVAQSEADLPKEANAALQQIEEMDYLAEFRAQGVENVWKYGIAFYGKKLKLAHR